ncbi:DegT/DnrJ/EryC1/StrS family aminotransferase [Candidatus Bathyarchaeota archaeon]|nr:DegT/DnrJ/EryC1/StrS family aminotransferase [Candidatus Bathyarchaeota archaeon]
MRRIRQFEPSFGEEEKKAVIDVIESGWINEGPKAKELETLFSSFVGSKYAVATMNGTIALALALMAVGIGRGDEVIVPDFTFVATANAVKLVGAEPVLVDIKQDDFTMDPDHFLSSITEKTRAVIPVHLNGRPADMKRIREIAEDKGIIVVEDAAQAIGSRTNGKYLGTFSKAGAFSLATTKIITTGQGGIVVTDDPEIHERLRRLKDHGRLDKSDHHPYIGYNFKLTDLQAAVGIAQFKKLNGRIQRSRELLKLYREELENIKGITFPETKPETVLWYVDILTDKPLRLKEYLESRGIETRPFYKPLHEQPCYRRDGNFENTCKVSSRGLWLPSSTFLSDEDIVYICNHIKGYFK